MTRYCILLVRLCLTAVPLTAFGMNADILPPEPLPQGFEAKTLVPNPPLPSLLDGRLQSKFVNPLVNVTAPEYIWKPTSKEDGVELYKIKRVPFTAKLGIYNSNGQQFHTPMFGFAAKHQPPSYPGRSFVVNSRTPIKVLWKNELADKKTGKPLPLPMYVPADQTIHIASPQNPTYPARGVPTDTHLHGGFTEYQSDGYPDAWATPFFAQHGSYFMKKTFTYSNAQQAALLWYHDHALGYTRLNNYAGFAGAYVIRDKNEAKLIKNHQIPSGDYEVPLIIVDKMFTSDGQLFFPYFDPTHVAQPQPSVLPEFFGDFMLVNGKAWPYLEVAPGKYRFRVLNACDSRFLDLHLVQNPAAPSDIPMVQIATDQGFLNSPVTISHILLAPAQRVDLVIDFSQFKGQTLTLMNTANAPYPDGDAPDPLSTGLVMTFNVTKDLNKKQPKVILPAHLQHKPIKTLHPTAPTRQVLLFETDDEYGRTMPLLGTPALGALMWMDPTTEKPVLGTTEIWEIYNTTADAHPIHLHAGNFQILDRQYFSGTQDPTTGVLTNITMLGSPIAPLPGEHKALFDTIIVPPASGGPAEAIGQRTRIIMHFSLAGQYVWHCHIVSHEDHDMMRPMEVVQPRK